MYLLPSLHRFNQHSYSRHAYPFPFIQILQPRDSLYLSFSLPFTFPSTSLTFTAYWRTLPIAKKCNRRILVIIIVHLSLLYFAMLNNVNYHNDILDEILIVLSFVAVRRLLSSCSRHTKSFVELNKLL